MVIHDPVKVRNPGGHEVWVDRARLPELLAQGFVVVLDPLDPKVAREEGQKPKRKRKAKDGGAK